MAISAMLTGMTAQQKFIVKVSVYYALSQMT